MANIFEKAAAKRQLRKMQTHSNTSLIAFATKNDGRIYMSLLQKNGRKFAEIADSREAVILVMYNTWKYYMG